MRTRTSARFTRAGESMDAAYGTTTSMQWFTGGRIWSSTYDWQNAQASRTLHDQPIHQRTRQSGGDTGPGGARAESLRHGHIGPPWKRSYTWTVYKHITSSAVDSTTLTHNRLTKHAYRENCQWAERLRRFEQRDCNSAVVRGRHADHRRTCQCIYGRDRAGITLGNRGHRTR